MRAEPLDEEVTPASGGVEPVAIAEAAGLSGEAMFETGAGKSQETFLDALQASLRAAILIEGEGSSLIRGEGDEAGFCHRLGQRARSISCCLPHFPCSERSKRTGS